MNEILISMLTHLGLGINGVIAQKFNNSGIHFADYLNKFTQNKFDFKVIDHKGNDYWFKSNNGVILHYVVNDNGAVKSLTISNEI